jgi:hypothetical protein
MFTTEQNEFPSFSISRASGGLTLSTTLKFESEEGVGSSDDLLEASVDCC